MAYAPAFLEELRARTPLASLIGRRTGLARSGRHWRACCPFHEEKTPSFYVYDDHFHCYGCGAHGDAISFVMQSQGASFAEAVAGLAAEAGLELPKPSPAAIEADTRQRDLFTILAAAEAGFQRRLWLPEGQAALAYLRARGLSDATIRGFGLGWSGDGHGTLGADLGRDAADPALLAEAGLMRESDEAGRHRALFFNRVMFPIRDLRGRVISFGGRVLGNAHPKYLNGPETAVFAKRRVLYAADRARNAAHGGAEVVLVEGYMDAIALHQAGFQGAVAPLGTALTEAHLEGLWRLAPSPVLCFDGDAAGARAALRAAELALPLLSPERTLRFASLAEGEDPDTVVGRAGAAGFAAVLAQARPMAETLFEMLRGGIDPRSPEQRAALRTRLEAAAQRIPVRALAAEYRRSLLDRFFAERRRGAGPIRPPAIRPIIAEVDQTAERARILIAILLRHPSLWHRVENLLIELALPSWLDSLREAIFRRVEEVDMLDSSGLIDHLTLSGMGSEVARALAGKPFPLPACASEEAMPAEAEAGWWHFYRLMHEHRLNEDIAAAERELRETMSEAAQRRLVALKAAQAASAGAEHDEAGP